MTLYMARVGIVIKRGEEILYSGDMLDMIYTVDPDSVDHDDVSVVVTDPQEVLPKIMTGKEFFASIENSAE